MFLANENFPKPSVEILRKLGFDVLCIAEISPGISDTEVIEIANKENLIILTFDKDYGELIFRYSYKFPPAVIFFREKGNDPLFPGNLLSEILTSAKIKLTNAFTVVESNGIRQRFYSKS